MKAEQLFDALTDQSDELVTAAERHVFRRAAPWRRWTAAAAALALVIGLAGIATGRIRIPGLGGKSGNGGAENGYTYMSYAGPVFPLSAEGDPAGVTAERNLDFDFSPYRTRTETYTDGDGNEQSYERYESRATVTDDYVLTNETDEARTLTLLYLVSSPLSELTDRGPAIRVNGEPVEAAWSAGDYSGGFAGAWGDENSGERLNLDEASSWEDYRALLADGTYLTSALAPETPPLDEPVTVYRIYGASAPEGTPDPATLAFSAAYDPQRTKLLTYGVQSYRSGYENGTFLCGFSGFVSPSPYNPSPEMYLILLGDDIGPYTLQGYRDGGCDAGEEIGLSASVERYSSTLGEMLRLIVNKRVEQDAAAADEYTWYRGTLSEDEMYFYMAAYLTRYGSLSDNPAERYAMSDLEQLWEALRVTRVVYYRFAVTVPAHGSVNVTAVTEKPASVNFRGKGAYRDQGYDAVTRLGSTLTFTAQRATLSHTEEIVLTGNSFGFDLKAGVTAVTLDPAQEHYWLQVRKK